MARRTYSRDDVQTHYGSDRPAVNVKVYESLSDGFRQFGKYEPDADPRFTEEWLREQLSDETLDAIFWDTCRSEFEMIEQDAEEILGRYAKVEQDGRSGGWAVVTGLPDLEDWDAVQLAKWRKFERYAKATAGDVMYQVVSSVYLNDWDAWRDEESERLGAEAFEAVGA